MNSISIWEIGLKVKKGEIKLGGTLREYVQRLKALNTLEIVALDETIWIESLHLDWHHRDPADRVIVATAKLRGAQLITEDEEIKRFYKKTIW